MKIELESTAMQTLYQTLRAAFCAIVVISNMISAKMVWFPYVDLSVPAGVLVYPLTFLLSNFVTEIYGQKKAQGMIYAAFGISLLSFGLIEAALHLPVGLLEIQPDYQSLLELSGLRIFASLAAFLIAQLVDIQLYTWIKQWSGPRFLWLRTNGSTCLSQMIDTVVIDLIFLYWGLGMEMNQVVPIMLFSYAYKAFFSLSCTPLFYVCVFLLRSRWIVSQRMFAFNQVK